MNAGAAYFKTGHEVSFSCNEGFSSPHSTTTCQAAKVWSPPPVCTDNTCKVPHLGNGRYIVISDNREANEREPYSTWISPVCNDSYTRSSFTPRKCGLDGQWSGTEVYCNPIICKRLPNGYYDRRDTQPPFPYNHEITAVCHSGYHLTQPATRRCIDHNTWSGTDPECRRITCRSPTTFSNGQYNGSQHVYDFGTVLVPTCNTDYFMSNNVYKRVCERPNTWSGSEPVCEIVECETPTVLNGHFSLRKISYKYRDTISIKCDQGYEIKDRSGTRTCQADGTWSENPMQCFKILCNDTSDVRHEHIDLYPALAIGENGRVSYNSEHLFLSSGYTEVMCSTSRKLKWIKAPEFGKICLKRVQKVFAVFSVIRLK